MNGNDSQYCNCSGYKDGIFPSFSTTYPMEKNIIDKENYYSNETKI